MPPSSASATAARCSACSPRTISPPMLPLPNPIADTRSPVRPRSRYSMRPSLRVARLGDALARVGAPPLLSVAEGRLVAADRHFEFVGPGVWLRPALDPDEHGLEDGRQGVTLIGQMVPPRGRELRKHRAIDDPFGLELA